MKPARWSILGGLVILLGLAAIVRAADTPSGNPQESKPADSHRQLAVIIQLQGEIDEYNRDALFHRFDQARQFGANVVILNVDTYGGLLTAGLEISRYIKRQDDLHVIAFVRDKAISAGAMIAMACDEIVMSSSSSLGDCAPIIFGPEGLETMAPAERAKAESPVLEDFAESARRNHHDPLLAAAMVDVKRSIYWVRNEQGERRFVDEKTYGQLKATNSWTDVPGAPVPIDGPNTLLSVDGQQAVEYGLATEQVNSAEALARERGYTIVADLSPGFGDKLVEILGSKAARALLILIFLQCVYVVLHAPGHGPAELCGLLALGLMLGVPMLNGYAQWWEILMIFAGLLLVAVEIVLPGHLIPGITGASLVLMGLVLTFVPAEPGGMPIFFNLHATWLAMRTGILVIAGALASSLILWYWIGRFLPRIPYVNRLILTATSNGQLMQSSEPSRRPSDQSANFASTPASKIPWPPIGAVGHAMTELRPGGSAEFFDAALADRRMTSVVSERGYIPMGAEIVVWSVDGPSVVVRPRT